MVKIRFYFNNCQYRVNEFFDEKDVPRVTFDVLNTRSILKLTGKNGSISVAFDEEGCLNLTLKYDISKNIWSGK